MNNSIGFVTKQCDWCNAPFEVGARREQQQKRRFCSRKCSVRSEWAAKRGIFSIADYQPKPRSTHSRLGRPAGAEKILMTCLNCGKEWQQYPWAEADRSKYCSRPCYDSARTGIAIKPKEERAHETKQCERCHTPFVVGGEGNRVRSTRFCGKQCSKLAFWEAHKEAGTDIHRPSMKGVPKPREAATETKLCLHCSAPFIVGGSGHTRTKSYCSRSCARRAGWAARHNGTAAPLSTSHSPAVRMARDDAKWFAGLFDGEGCVSWPHRKETWKINASISVTNTSYPLLERLIEVTGTGRINTQARQDDLLRHQPCWVWGCHGANARSILEQILPFLIVKKEAAEYALRGERLIQPPIAIRNRHRVKTDPDEPALL